MRGGTVAVPTTTGIGFAGSRPATSVGEGGLGGAGVGGEMCYFLASVRWGGELFAVADVGWLEDDLAHWFVSSPKGRRCVHTARFCACFGEGLDQPSGSSDGIALLQQ